MRRPMLAICGYGGTLDAPVEAACVELGRLAVERGFRVVTGGLGGVMEAASRGARTSTKWRDGDVVGVLPGYDRTAANPFVDVVVPTGLNVARNVVVVAMADAVVIVAGGAGTLSEIAVAWQLGKPIVALAPTGGWAAGMAGARVDDRRADTILAAATPAEAVELAARLAVVEP